MSKSNQILNLPSLRLDGPTTTPERTKRNDTRTKPRQSRPANASAQPRVRPTHELQLVPLAHLKPGDEIAWQDAPRRVRSKTHAHDEDRLILELQPRVEGRYYDEHYWVVGPVLGVLKVELLSKNTRAERGRP